MTIVDPLSPEASLFFIDTGKKLESDEPIPKAASSEAAWIDEDDKKFSVSSLDQERVKRLKHSLNENITDADQYGLRLREQFERLNPRPRWARSTLDSASISGEEDSDLETLTHAPFSILSSKHTGMRSPLLPDIISIRRLRNINFSNSTKGVITALHYHPTQPWVLVCGGDRMMHIFEVDSLENKALFSLKIVEWNILDAKFTTDGSRVVISGTGPGLLIWHILEKRIEKIRTVLGSCEKYFSKLQVSPCGRFIGLKGESGCIVILSAATLQVIANFRVNNDILSFVFSNDGNFLLVVGLESKIYVWETRKFRCIKTVSDDSGTICTCVSVSPDGNYLAVGSNMGIVNLYELPRILHPECKTFKPLRALLNLNTAITTITFHPSSELMAYSSSERQNALRIVHLSSGRVFSNWPTNNTPISHAFHIVFNPSGHIMLVGNGKGQVLTCGIRHYE